MRRKRSKKILIWGTGQLSWHTIQKISEDDIVGFVDTFKKTEQFAGKPVFFPNEVGDIEFDAILVSLLKTQQVYEKCIECAIDIKKVIFVYGNARIQDLNKDYIFIEEICGSVFANEIKERYHLIREIDEKKGNSTFFDIDRLKSYAMYQTDYIRVKTLELVANDIYENNRNEKGASAELGVFRGDFAQLINLIFPHNTLYLFDTFEGFEEKELAKEQTGIMQDAGRDIFKNTTEDIVLDKMPFPEKVVIKKGFFPASLEGLEDKFSFVSLDCDWEESIFQGLLYFYPRLINGGYIMIHDYNNFLGSAKIAVNRYEEHIGHNLSKFPLCDNQGSLIITK